ncbi:MAG: hypothetical protein LBS21_11560 [Clostridiales bacterium]|nr:hypothetical protein [Clostridiales bacterium]
MKHNLYPVLASVICGIVIFSTINFPMPSGYSNSGDFLRVIEPARIDFIGNNPNRHVFAANFSMRLSSGTFFQQVNYFLSPKYSQFDYYTSQTPLIILSKVLNLASNAVFRRPLTNYSIVWMGFLYTLIFAFSLYLIYNFLLKRFGFKVFIFGFIVGLTVFCDQAYTLYFNSFYGEAMQYAASFLSIGLFLNLAFREKHIILHYLAYYFSVALMAMSKYAFAPVGLLFAVLPTAYVLREKKYRKLVLTASAVSVIAFSFYFFFKVPAFIEEDTAFNTVFSGVLKYSDTPERDLQDMGFNPNLAVLKGREAYQSGYPIDIKSEEFRQMFYGKFSKIAIVKFYITHPKRFWEALKFTSENSKYIRPVYLPSNIYPDGENTQSARFSLWEPLRVNMPFNKLWFIIPFLAAVLYISVNSARRTEPLGFLGIVLIVSCVYNFITPYMGNGICDIAKHLFGFIQFFDLLIFAGFAVLFNKFRSIKKAA